MRILLAALVLMASGCASASAQVEPPLNVATYAYPHYDREQALAGLADLVRDETGREVIVTLHPTPDALAAAIREGRADIAMTNLAAFLAVADRADVQPLGVLATPPEVLDGYRGVLLARRNAGVETLADLTAAASGLRYVEVLPGSTSGALVQRRAFRAAAFDPDRFSSHAHAGTHDAAVEALLAGQADVAAAAERPWRNLKASRPAEVAGLVEVWRSEPLPPGPVVCVRRGSTPCDALGRRLLARDAASLAAARTLAGGWAETAGAKAFIAYDPERYDFGPVEGVR